jgi:hypothetical protein
VGRNVTADRSPVGISCTRRLRESDICLGK